MVLKRTVGGSLGGCSQRQWFNLFSLIVAPSICGRLFHGLHYPSAGRPAHSSWPTSPGILEKTRANGDFVRYNPATDEFGVVSSSGSFEHVTSRMLRFTGGSNLDYFNAQ
jgi:hypothetical protein